MANLSTISADLSSLAASLITLAGQPSAPFTAVNSPALTAASEDTLNSKANIDVLLAGVSKSSPSDIDVCDREVTVANAMLNAVNSGVPGTLTDVGILHQVSVANVMARALR